ncbi:MAG: bifunctional hydroxymethylpyrimidine kinase/phosphomethylpyrimidine kinase, partial [Nitrospinaceae bacterium]|nr:bifunctional hydroxymethylpyrimidine kinase/phosphomethylpyrimidine kinase [Nitrospinaceae bacterium]NIR57558.1 bifunctional hydroxymethylpyrimidine kinase/phosphomethylpyrimidine kinase [Nitrospinaceae bacterium]NIS88028.1 bifunctional hydroxymethylpyrimidine kinase/phosphomethylpyrimidine kinase [Nitrospinaceae bacterium]NIT84892.1 bifunctional hydroxymethylpyrimidine kinase/phosphomethylpyrimidine kinase [Nitrospinaceae bacterium]NIU47068.1 bifunctional hydroxymethylpyrimidine kinase/phos
GEPLAGLYQSEERWDLQARMTRAVERLKASRIGRLVPEVQSNLGMALEGARTDEEVIAFPGRIIKLGEDIVTVAPPRFGASRHVAHVILTAMRHDPSQRAVMNIQFSPTLLTACRKLKFKLGQFDRAGEPRRVKEKEGSSLEWGTDRAIRKCGFVPDVIYDRGGPGKEEMIR